MRTVKLTEFLTLPEGTVYEMVSPNHVPEGTILVKGETLGDNLDWYEMSLGGVATLRSEDYPDSIDGWCALLENTDLRVPYQDNVWGRYGSYLTEKDDYTFLIYEPDDVAKMVSSLTAAWFQSKYPTTRFGWGYNGIVTLVENLLSQSTNDEPTVIYQILTHDGWLDCPREDYLRKYKTDPNETRIVSLVVEGSNDLVLSYFQASELDASTTRETSTDTSDIVTTKIPEPITTVDDNTTDPASSLRGEAIDHFDPPAMWSVDVGVLMPPVILNKMPAVTEFSFKKYIETVCFMTLDIDAVNSLKPNTTGKIAIIRDDKFYPMLSETYDDTWFSLFVIQNIGGRVSGIILSDCYFRPGNVLIFGNVIAIPESKLDLTRRSFSFKKIT